MTNTTHLKSYTDMHEAIEAIDILYAQYLKAHKKKATIDLTVASLATPFVGGRKVGPEPVEIRVKWSNDQKAEMQWFVEAVK